MIGMSFLSFIVLLGVSVIVAAVLHYGERDRFLDGADAVFAKVALGWLGAWLGSPVFGHWLYKIGDVYLVPAILGSLAAIRLNAIALTALERALAGRPGTGKARVGYLDAAKSALG